MYCLLSTAFCSIFVLICLIINVYNFPNAVIAQDSDFNDRLVNRSLNLTVIIEKNPIYAGDIQTLQFIVMDANTGQPINRASITGVSTSPSYKLNFGVYSDSRGMASYSWQIPNNAVPGIFTLLLSVDSKGYETKLYFKEFEVN